MRSGEVIRYLTDRGISFCLIGARAMAFHGVVRSTLDTDFLTTDRNVLSATFWSDLADAGVDVRKGDFDDPLAGVVRITVPNDQVDVVVAKYKWQKAVVERATEMEFGGSATPVARKADLILLKLWSAGGLDIRDVHDLARDPEVLPEVDRLVSDLADDVQQLWQRVRSERDGLQ